MARYELTVTASFNAAHFLRNYKGKCKRLHGHSYLVEATFGGEELNQQGMLVDFGLAKAWLSEAVETFDHRLLNDSPKFEIANPTAENLAAVLFASLQQKLTTPGVELVKVSVAENPGSQAVYWG